MPGLSKEVREAKEDVTGSTALYNLLPLEEESEPDKLQNNPTIILNNFNNPNNKVDIDPQGKIDVDYTFKTASEGIPVVQSGGRPKRYQNVSFIFNNKMAPRYIAVSNLFRTATFQGDSRESDLQKLTYILQLLSGASVIGSNEVNRALLNQGLTNADIQTELLSIAAPNFGEDINSITDSISGGKNILQKGGSLDDMLSSLESILKNEKFAPHPLLPIYLILESYCTELGVTCIKDSWDYEDFVQFFTLVNKLINSLLNIYSGEKNTNMNKLKACIVGYGLRELIFTSHQYIDRDPICTEALNIGLDNYNPLSKLFSILVNRVCGIVNQTPEDIQLGNEYISNPIFKEYADEINFRVILNSDVPDVDTYQLAIKSNELFLAVGRKIISDTNGEPNDELLGLTSSNPLPLETILSEALSPEISSEDISVNEDLKSNTLSNMQDPTGAHERRKNIEKMKAEGTFVPSKFTSPLPKYDNREIHSNFDSKNNKNKIEDNAGIQYITTSSSNSSSNGSIGSIGGKKTRKYRRHFKNRRTKRNNRRIKRRITKKNKRVRKNNRSRK
jgi:hypothetical protein